MKFKIILLLFFTIFCLTINAQNQQIIDSLYSELKSANDTTRINLLNKIALKYSNYKPDSTSKYANIALQDAKSISFETGMAKAYEILGEYSFNKGEYELAENYYNKSLQIYIKNENNNEIAALSVELSAVYIRKNDILDALTLLNKAKNLGDDETVASCNYSIAYIYALIENYEKSLLYIFLSLKYYETQKDSIQIGHCNNLMGHIYSNIDNDSLALIHYTCALNISKTRSKRDYAYALGNIAILNNRNGKYEVAISKHLEVAKIFIEIQDIYSLANTYNNLGNSYLELNNFSEAEQYYNLAKDIRIKLNDSIGLAINYLNLGNLYKKNNKINKSIEYFMNSIKIAKKYHATSTLRENYYYLFEIYLKQKNYKLALDYHLKHIEIKDSIFTLEKEHSIDNLTISYETEKKDQQITFLNKENDLMKQVVSQQKKTFFLLIFILIGICFFVILLILIYLKLKKSYKQIVKKDAEVIIAEKTIGKNIKKINDLKYSKDSSEKEIASKIIDLMENKNVFIDNNISVSVLAAYCNTNPKYISSAINNVFNQNFNNFINEYRIKYACRLLMQEKFKSYSFSAIAKEVGFNSNTTFINSFKKNTGVTPSYYVKNINNS